MEQSAEEVVELWWLDLDLLAARAPGWAALLPADELQQAELFAFPELQQRYRATRAGLRLILAEYCGQHPRELPLRRSTTGKPYLAPGGKLEFNLSHSGSTALLAIARGRQLHIPVGVDLEQPRPDLDWQGISQQVFHPLEQAAVAAGGWRTFFILWTRKEAWLKATGTGWTEQARQISVISEHWNPEQMKGEQLLIAEQNWWLQNLTLPDTRNGKWVAALCQSDFNLPICWRTEEELGCLWKRWC